MDSCIQETDGIRGHTVRVIEADPGLIIEYRMRPVLMVQVLEPVFQHAVVAAMIRCQSRAPVWMFRLISSCYKDTASISPDKLHPDSGR